MCRLAFGEVFGGDPEREFLSDDEEVSLQEQADFALGVAASEGYSYTEIEILEQSSLAVFHRFDPYADQEDSADAQQQ